MSGPVVYVDQSEIREGKVEQLEEAMDELVAFVEANEPQLVAYNVYFSEDGARMTVLHMHSDSASLETHMRVAGPLFPKFAEFIKLLRIDLYGEPSEDLVRQLRQKAQMLGSETVLVHRLHRGFARFPTR
jgi:quinol monooxygenase YgiN